MAESASTDLPSDILQIADGPIITCEEHILDSLWEACNESQSVFLLQLELAAQNLHLPKSDRSYRSCFTDNYVQLFSIGRCYRVELLNACMDLRSIVVNSTTYPLRPITLDKGKSLLRCIYKILDDLCQSQTSPNKYRDSDLKSSLITFDKFWAVFEEHYIGDLIEIESRAREPVTNAVALEQKLLCLEREHELDTVVPILKKCRHRQLRHINLSVTRNLTEQGISSDGSTPISKTLLEVPTSQSLEGEYVSPFIKSSVHNLAKLAQVASKRWANSSLNHVLGELMGQIIDLNVSINNHCRDHESPALRVLETAAEIFLSSETSNWNQNNHSGVPSASEVARRLLASQVLSGFVEIRVYLTGLKDHLELIDPQLSNNRILTLLLSRWEESCELGARLLLEPGLLKALCGVAGRIGHTPHFAPELMIHLESQDAEFFLILPRLVLLCAFVDPTLMILPANLLPHHFLDVNESTLSCEMSNLFQRFQEFCGKFPVEKTDALPQGLWQILVQGAVIGPGQDLNTDDYDDTTRQFLHHLEGFSIELQRHKPEEWNQCCLSLTQCIEAVAETIRLQRAHVKVSMATI